MEERIFDQFVNVVNVPADVDRSTIRYNETLGWDSVAHMTLIAALETEFDCMLDMEDILDMSSYDKAIAIMRKHV